MVCMESAHHKFDWFFPWGGVGCSKQAWWGWVCSKYRWSTLFLFFFSTLHQQIKTNSLLKCEEETLRFHNQVPHIGMFLSFLSILQNVFFKNQWVTSNVNPMGGGRAKKNNVFMFIYQSTPDLRWFFWWFLPLGDGLSGTGFHFLDVSPYWRNSTLLFCHFFIRTIRYQLIWKYSISLPLLGIVCFESVMLQLLV